MNIDTIAQQIVALINSHPRSPSVDEIKGVLTSHVQEVITGMPPILSEKDLADIAKRMDVSPGGMITLDNRPTAEIMDFWQFQHRIDERCGECRYRRPDYPFDEIQPNLVAAIYCDPLVCFVRLAGEEADKAGDSITPPKLFVVNWHDEYAACNLHSVSFHIAEALNPEKMKALCDMLYRFRCEREEAAKILASNDGDDSKNGWWKYMTAYAGDLAIYKIRSEVVAEVE